MTFSGLVFVHGGLQFGNVCLELASCATCFLCSLSGLSKTVMSGRILLLSSAALQGRDDLQLQASYYVLSSKGVSLAVPTSGPACCVFELVCCFCICSQLDEVISLFAFDERLYVADAHTSVRNIAMIASCLANYCLFRSGCVHYTQSSTGSWATIHLFAPQSDPKTGNSAVTLCLPCRINCSVMLSLLL